MTAPDDPPPTADHLPDGELAISTAFAVPPTTSSGQYELSEEIARGGMGAVYRAFDVALGREVAVKVLQAKYDAGSGVARRFVEEARITGQLQHPGIPAVYQVGTMSDGRPFLAMKLIKGQTLDELLQSRVPIDPLAIFEAIGQAVGYAHSHSVIHRDLKPANIMVGAFGEVQVMDWGLAKVLTEIETRPTRADPDATVARTEIKTGRESETPYTQYGSVLGTPSFMAPEQAAGESNKIDTRSDVFGLGAILCVLLTGKPPFGGEGAESVRINAVRGRTEEAFARLDGCGADPEVIALCKRCLAFEPANRPATGYDVATAVTDLRRAADGRARQAERDKLGAELRATELVKRRRVALRAAGLIAAVLLMGVAGTTVGLIRANAARRDAETAERATEAKRVEAETAWEAEALQRKLAEAKETEANTVVAFFDAKVFAAARPKWWQGGLGKDVTLRDAIAASVPALATEFADQPLVEARLRLALGTSFYYLGEDTAAVDQFERAKSIYSAHYGPDHETTVRCLNYLANSFEATGRYVEALKLREESLTIRRRVLPPDHPDTLWSMNDLAVSYQTLHRHAEALILREDTLAARRRILPPDHPDTLRIMNALASSYDRADRHLDALRLNEEVLATRRRLLPPDHPDTLGSARSLAMTYAAMNRHADALKLRSETLAARRRVLPPDHPDTLRSMIDLAYSLEPNNDRVEALVLLKKGVAGFRPFRAPDHPDTWQNLVDLAYSLEETIRHVEALKLREEALAGHRRVHSPDHPDTLASVWGVATSLFNLNRGAEAIPFIDEYVKQATGKALAVHDPKVLSGIIYRRLRHFQGTGDPVGCRASAEMFENLNRLDAGNLYDAACFRAVASAVQAKVPGGAAGKLAADDADRSMLWLTTAVLNGYRNRFHMERDADLDALRGRADFRKLLESLPKSP